MIGENIRQARLARQWSLSDVAKKAKISVATLSRIENDKQTLELRLFLNLARILERSPDELLEEENAGDRSSGLDPLVKKIATFEANERARLWRELAAAQRARLQRAKSRRLQLSQLAQHIEELVAQVDFLREELESVRKRLRSSR
jgi:transcriptional regulator with XRE-family HTH domain